MYVHAANQENLWREYNELKSYGHVVSGLHLVIQLKICYTLG